MRRLLFLIVSYAASVAGAVCGIGGGVVIKPALDLLQLTSVPEASFLSGCTVLAMSGYSVVRGILPPGDRAIDLSAATPLAVGAAAGGMLGKQIFTALSAASASSHIVGGVQSGCLAGAVLLTLLYTVRKSRIRTKQVRHPAACVLAGLALGLISSFLGIGGGPMNLVVLFYFFSMDTKTAAANSLYIILFSQIASLAFTVATHTVPEFQTPAAVLMAVGGVSGGITGRAINRRIDAASVDKLFVGLMVCIICISVCNAWRYLR